MAACLLWSPGERIACIPVVDSRRALSSTLVSAALSTEPGNEVYCVSKIHTVGPEFITRRVIISASHWFYLGIDNILNIRDEYHILLSNSLIFFLKWLVKLLNAYSND